MNEIQIFRNAAFGEIRTCTDDKGDPWFNAVDVCKALGHTNVTRALKLHVHDDDLTKCKTMQGGKRREVNFINESGLYALVLGSKLPNAREFKRWVTSEVRRVTTDETVVFLRTKNAMKPSEND